MTRDALTRVLKETLRRNRVRNGIVYLQVTRGTARRDHPFPPEGTPPSVIVTARSISAVKAEAQADKGVAVITQPDTRWGRCDIKTVGLLPNILAKQAARDSGAYEAWFVDDMGLVTEGSSTNAWIIDEHGRLRTRDTQANILRGITRAAIMALVKQEKIELDERPFSVNRQHSVDRPVGFGRIQISDLCGDRELAVDLPIRFRQIQVNDRPVHGQFAVDLPVRGGVVSRRCGGLVEQQKKAHTSPLPWPGNPTDPTTHPSSETSQIVFTRPRTSSMSTPPPANAMISIQ